MKTYVSTTGTVFGLLAVMHIWRVVAEGPRMLSEPVFIIFTIASVALCIWAFSLLGISARANDPKSTRPES